MNNIYSVYDYLYLALNNEKVDKFCEDHVIPNILEFKDFRKFIYERRLLLRSKLKKLV